MAVTFMVREVYLLNEVYLKENYFGSESFMGSLKNYPKTLCVHSCPTQLYLTITVIFFVQMTNGCEKHQT